MSISGLPRRLWIALMTLLALPVLVIADPPSPAQAAHAFAAQQKWEEAAKEYKKLIDANPYAGGNYYNYASCLHALKHYDEARPAYERAIELGSIRAGSMYNIACGYALMGKTEEAFAWRQKALDSGFAEQDTLANDTDMESVRADPRYSALTGVNPPAGLSREQQWLFDLDFFARRMKQMHWDLFRKVSQEEFHGEIEKLKAAVPKLTDQQILVRLKRIVAGVGDGHTSLALRRPDETGIPWLPIQLYQFPEGLFIRSADPSLKDLLGARVLKFGEIDAPDAFERAKPYCSVDNSMGYLDGVPMLLGSPWILEAIGAAGNTGSVKLTVQKRGQSEPSVVRVTPLLRNPSHEQPVDGTKWPTVPETSDRPLPLYLQKRDTSLWREYLPEKKMVYVWFGSVADPKGSTFEQFMQELFDFIDRNDVQHLVIDMRLNGGGNTGLVLPLVHGLVQCRKINQPGRLFVIIGRRTFSAAMNTTSLLEMHTNATFVGEPTGSSPNFVGESTWFPLPYHKNRVYCSSRYWQFRTSTDTRTWIPPQIAAPLSFADYSANRDPAMAAIEQAIAAQWATVPATQPSAEAGKSSGN